MGNNNKQKANYDLESQQFINFIEDFCWLLDSNKNLNFKNISKFLTQKRNMLAHSTIIENKTDDSYNLIGVLPSLLRDAEIFRNNSQLAQFAVEVLALNIPRWEKRSRNEIIGLIICEVEAVNKERLDTLTKWASNILDNKNTVKDLQSRAKNSGCLFSWNETIQKLVDVENE